MHTIKVYNGMPKEGQKIIFCGPYVGSWGHLFHFHIPIVNRIREEEPDAFLVSAGYVGDDYYYKNPKGQHTIDGYIAFPTNPDIRRAYGLGQANFGDDIRNADRICEKNFGPIDVNHRTPAVDNQWFSFIDRMKRTHYRLGTFAPQSLVYEEFVLLHSKNSRPLEGRDPRGEQIANADKDFDDEYVHELARHIMVVVIGIPDECNAYDGANIQNLTGLSAEQRPHVLLGLTNAARLMISTSSASTINYALSVGCPSLCFASRRYKDNHDKKYNYYGVPTNHHYLFDFDVDKRVKETLKTIERFKHIPRYTHDVRRIDKDMGSWL